MALSNAEKQARFRAISELMIRIYEDFTGMERGFVRKLARVMVDMDLHRDIPDNPYGGEDED